MSTTNDCISYTLTTRQSSSFVAYAPPIVEMDKKCSLTASYEAHVSLYLEMKKK
jgi:hypothetical protein